jgi:O-antigen ligase
MSIAALGFLGVYFSGLFIAVFQRKPIYGVVSYLVAFYLHPPVRWWGQSLPDLRWSLLAALVTLFAVFLNRDKVKFKFFEFRENKLILAFCTYILIQSSWALSFELHWVYVTLFFKFLILIMLFQNSIKTEKDLVLFVFVNAIGCSYFGYLGLTEHAGGRLESVGGPGLVSANQLAQHIGVILVFSSYLILCKVPLWMKGIIAIAIALNLEAIMLTQSRSVLIAIVVTGAMSIFFVPKQHKKKYWLFLFLGVTAFTALMGSQIVSRIDNLTGNNSSGVQDKSASSRMIIIKSQYDMFKDSPLFGVGHRGTLILSPFYVPKAYRAQNTKNKQGNTYRASHNFIMAVLVDHGLIGGLLYFSVILSCLYRVRKIYKANIDEEELITIKTLFIGLGLSLFCLMVAGLGSNNKVLEIDIWLYALIPLIYQMLINNNVVKKDDN